MKIRVTEEDIKLGTPADPFCCAVARAVRRETGFGDVCVGPLYICGWIDPLTEDYRSDIDKALRWVPDKEWHDVPGEVGQFIELFDDESSVGPFEFEL